MGGKMSNDKTTIALRLDPVLDQVIEAAAGTLGLTKTAWIMSIIMPAARRVLRAADQDFDYRIVSSGDYTVTTNEGD